MARTRRIGHLRPVDGISTSWSTPQVEKNPTGEFVSVADIQGGFGLPVDPELDLTASILLAGQKATHRAFVEGLTT